MRLLITLLLAAVPALLPATARAHTSVERTSPAHGDTLVTGPAELRLRFSGRAEPALTVLALSRGGAHVAAGGRMVEGSAGREYVLELARPLEPGSYVASWRTVGADGHALRGEWSFVVAEDPAAAGAPAAAPATEPPPAPPFPIAEPVERLVDPVAVGVRWLWFASLLGIIGAAGFRFGVLPRLARDPAHREVGARAEAAVWFVALAAAALSVLSLFARLWLQASALGGGSAWEGDRLRVLLTGTSWGLAWTLQAIATLAFFVGLLIVRAPHGRAAGWMGAAVGALLLAAVPALSGHAAAGGNGLSILADALHVLGAGLWLGTLGVVLAVGVPAALTSRDAPDAAVAALVSGFTPVALAGASTVAVTGIVSALFRLSAPGDLWRTPYGLALLVKLALVGVVVALGWYHWRRGAPGLGAGGTVPALRRSIRAELALAGLVLLVTAVLVALPTPS